MRITPDAKKIFSGFNNIMINSVSPVSFQAQKPLAIKNIKSNLTSDVFQSSYQNYQERLLASMRWENFSKIKLFKKLNTLEKKIFQSEITLVEKEQLFATALGYKPACYFSRPHYINKLTSLPNQPLDILHCKQPQNSGALNKNAVVIFNKNAMKNIIEANKTFYIQQLELKNDTTTEEIYNTLKKDKNLLLKHDLLGVSLGFPLKDSIIYGLESILKSKGVDTLALRENLNLYKAKITEILHSPDSPIKDMKLRKEIEETISKIKEIKPTGESYMRYISYTNDPSSAPTLHNYFNQFSINKLV